MTPTPRAALVVAGAAGSFLLVGRLGILVVLAALTAIVVDAVVVRRPPQSNRSVPSILPRGQSFPFRVGIDSPFKRRALVRQPHPPDLLISPDEAVGGLDGTILARRRGGHELDPVVVRSVGPLGLGAWQHRVGDSVEVTVYPDVVTARHIARAVAQGRFAEQGTRRTPRLGLGTEFESIREFTPDDDVRQMNWRATMRLGKPMSNQYRVDQDRDVICVVDVGRLMGSPLGPLTRLDTAVDAVAAIAYTADALGDRVGVVAFDQAVVRSLSPRRRGGEAVVHAVHDLEPTGAESDYEAAFRAVARGKRGLVVLFTDLLEEAAAGPLLESIPILSRTHQVVIAANRDVDLSSAIEDDPADTYAVYRSAVAVEALEARDRVVGQLRHVGAIVVQADPGKLPAACVAAYIDAKALARV
ncbi:MAG: DUF58 domain-containing protein [Acidimicrobiia bacterium]